MWLALIPILFGRKYFSESAYHHINKFDQLRCEYNSPGFANQQHYAPGMLCLAMWDRRWLQNGCCKARRPASSTQSPGPLDKLIY